MSFIVGKNNIFTGRMPHPVGSGGDYPISLRIDLLHFSRFGNHSACLIPTDMKHKTIRSIITKCMAIHTTIFYQRSRDESLFFKSREVPLKKCQTFSQFISRFYQTISQIWINRISNHMNRKRFIPQPLVLIANKNLNKQVFSFAGFQHVSPLFQRNINLLPSFANVKQVFSFPEFHLYPVSSLHLKIQRSHIYRYSHLPVVRKYPGIIIHLIHLHSFTYTAANTPQKRK